MQIIITKREINARRSSQLITAQTNLPCEPEAIISIKHRKNTSVSIDLMLHLSDLPLFLHWPHTGVIACRDLSAQFNTKKGKELAGEKANGHVASRRVYNSYP